MKLIMSETDSRLNQGLFEKMIRSISCLGYTYIDTSKSFSDQNKQGLVQKVLVNLLNSILEKVFM